MKVESTPSDRLAELTASRLVKAGLMREERRQALTARIASGKMNAADWRSELDLASSTKTIS